MNLTVAHAGKSKSVPYSVQNTGSNELASLLNTASLHALGVTGPGKYTFTILRGKKQLASGSLIEK